MTGIGLKIKELRIERDLTMEMLVADMNAKYELDKPINKSMVSRWENGDNDPTLENAKYLSMYFDVSLDYLIGNSNIRTPSRLLALQKKKEV
jgi:transcriptional regulator with XRE-family HTH domain